MSASYGWIIDSETVTTAEDHRLFKSTGGGEGMPSRKGWTGPRNIYRVTERRLLNGEGRKFRMYDDDGNLCYSGRYLGPDGEEMFGPLSDLGTPDAGATRIDYLSPGGKWETL